MRTKKHLNYLFLVAFILLGFVSCNSSDDSPVDLSLGMKSVDLKLGEIASIYIVSGNGEYTVSTSNQNIVLASVDNNIIILTPLSKGEVTLKVIDKENKVATATLTVKDPYLGIYVVDRDITVSVTDATIRSLISKEVSSSSSLQLKYLYDLSKNTTNSYKLYKENWNTVAVGSGNYEFNDYTLTLSSNNSKNIYLLDQNNSAATIFYKYFNSTTDGVSESKSTTTRTSIEESFFNITEDLTDEYKILYPDAGVNTVQIIATVQLLNYNYQY